MPLKYKAVAHRGFTLIELLVVIAIIGILASVVLASLNSAREKGRNAAYTSQIKEYQKAFELYFSTVGTYPSQGTQTWACIGTGYAGGTCWPTSALNETNSAAFRTAIAPYISSTAIPGSTSNSSYEGAMYRLLNSGRNYQLIYILDGANTNCPIGTKTVNTAYSNLNITRCDYTHPL